MQRTYTRCIRPAASMMAKAHLAVHRVTSGRVGQRWRGGEVGMLSTIGRRSGQQRTTPLVCLRDGADVVVVASNGGSDRSPEWWLNLQHRPYGQLELGGRNYSVTAESATADTYARLSERFCESFPCFRHYRTRTERVIPVIVLTLCREVSTRPSPDRLRPSLRPQHTTAGGIRQGDTRLPHPRRAQVQGS
jgi:deazaflavin-dependent oxidoreductase (nitroreductase family)